MGKQLAQDGGPGNTSTGVQLLLADPADYNIGILQALRIFQLDRPNYRIVDQVLADNGWRFVLKGSGVLTSLIGPDAWVDGVSQLQRIWHPWEVTNQGQGPIEDNDWRIVRDPGGVIVLEFLRTTAISGQAVRLEFITKHTLSEQPNDVAAPVAPAVSLANPAAPGNVTNGLHAVVATYLTADGQTSPSPATNIVVADQTVNGQVTVVIAASPDSGITGVRVFMSDAGGAGDKKLAGTLATNGGTLTINLADGSLGEAAPTSNTAGGVNTVADGDEDLLTLLVASVFLELAAVKAAQNTGNTGLPNDVVDRRHQSDVFRSRSKELRDMYNTLAGKGGATDLSGASTTKDMDVATGHTFGWLNPARRNS